MKLKLNPFAKDAGNALLTTVIFIVVLTLSIGGYMTYVLQQVRLGGRSQAWNMAMAVSEAGIEEGFEHLNDDPTALGNDGWSSDGGGVYHVQREIDGTFKSSYTVYITNANPAAPNITSFAYVTPPAVARKTRWPFFYAAATGNQPVQYSSVTTVGRGIQAVLTKPIFFNAALVARGNINMNGNGVTVDSFDSGMMNSNVNGQWAQSISGDDGVVASDGGISNSVSVGNANIYGPLYTGPNEPESVGPNGAVGTHAWQAANGSGVEPGYLHTTANFTFPDTSLPANYNTYTTPTSGSVLQVTGTNNVATTNANMASYPTGLTNGQSLSKITTNTTLTTVSTYPGAMPGLSSNQTPVTVNFYPGPQTQLATNCTGFVTVSANPGPQMCLSSGTVVSNSSSYPLSGTYTGNVTTNLSSNGKKVTGYTYNATWYTYGNVFTYTYQSWEWTYPTTTYSYVLYSSALTYATNNYDAVLSGGNYYANSLGNTIITGPVTLVMPSGYSITGLTIAPGGSLTIYVGGTSLSLDGNSVVNQPGLAQNLIIYCAPTVTSFTLGGNAGLNAVIVAPNANVSLHGGGNNNFDFSGSLMANSITLNGHWNFHYDVALSRVPSTQPYILQSWREIPVAQQ